VVGNVIYQGYTTRSHPAIRIGGDGTGQTFGRYRFVNNTVIMGNASTATVFRVFDGIESVEMHNNALFRQGSGAVNVLTDGDASWRNGRQIAGRNNWVTTGSTGIPSTWTTTRQGASPGFVDVGQRNVALSATSPLRDTGTSSFAGPTGYTFPSPLAAAAYQPPAHVLLAVGSAVPRAPVGVVDIGAFEYGNTGTPPPAPPPTSTPTTPPPPPPPPPVPTTPPPPAGSPVILYPIEDAFVRNGTYASTNFGTATALDVKSDSEPNLTRDAYLRFNLGSVPSVSSAKFRVYTALSYSDSVTPSLYPVTGSWSETTLTWNSRPGYVSSNPLGAFTVTSTSYTWKEIDITPFVRSEHGAGRRVLSFALHSPATSVEKLIFPSREAASNRPELVVTP
jgi:hypothetical protein